MSRLSPLFASFALAALFPPACAAQSALPREDAASYSRSFSRGVEEFDAGRYTEALEEFLRAAQSNPEDAEAVFDAGVAYEKRDRLVEASAAFGRAVEIRPGYQLGEFRHSLASLGRAVALAPESGEMKSAYERVAGEIEGLDREIDSS